MGGPGGLVGNGEGRDLGLGRGPRSVNRGDRKERETWGRSSLGSRKGEGTSGLCPAVPSTSGALHTPWLSLPSTPNSLLIFIYFKMCFY